MIRKLRRFAALLALLALSLSVAEEGWAAACGDAGSPATQVAAESGASHSQHAPSLGAAGGEPTSDADGDPSSCPMAVAAGMACGVVALGSPSTSRVVASGLSTDVQPMADHPVGSGALSSLFRPPQQ